ncbi:MAG: hypothetical protein WC917_00745 [Bacilli bacterium]|jgi:hypothetical protein
MKIIDGILERLFMITIIISGIIYISIFTYSKLPDEWKSNLLSGSEYGNSQIMMGSSTNAVSMPKSFVEANSTTTNSGTVSDPGIVNQFINTQGTKEIIFSGLAIGGTATSTCMIAPQVSNDGSNWFYVTGSSSSTDIVATSTLNIDKHILTFDPGVNTTTFSYPLTIPKADYTRLLFAEENASTDPNDGCQAYIEVALIKEY